MPISANNYIFTDLISVEFVRENNRFSIYLSILVSQLQIFV